VARHTFAPLTVLASIKITATGRISLLGMINSAVTAEVI